MSHDMYVFFEVLTECESARVKKYSEGGVRIVPSIYLDLTDFSLYNINTS